MSRYAPAPIMTIAVGLLVAAGPLSSQMSKPQPLTLPLVCPKTDCPLLEGAPQTVGMRGGFVRLKPGETVGWHSTGQHEEALVILHGEGVALIDGRPKQAFAAPALTYIPPATRHNVQNTGKVLLEYVYVVAPVK